MVRPPADRRAERAGHIGTGRRRVPQALGAALGARDALHVLMPRVELVDVVERGPDEAHLLRNQGLCTWQMGERVDLGRLHFQSLWLDDGLAPDGPETGAGLPLGDVGEWHLKKTRGPSCDGEGRGEGRRRGPPGGPRRPRGCGAGSSAGTGSAAGWRPPWPLDRLCLFWSSVFFFDRLPLN